MTHSIQIPSLTIEPCEDGTLLLEQANGGTIDRIQIHPLHVRLMTEHFGLAGASNESSARQIATLERRLRLVQSEMDKLLEFLRDPPEDGHDNFPEFVICNQICTMLNEFVQDFQGAPLADSPAAIPAAKPEPSTVKAGPKAEPAQAELLTDD